MCLYMVVFGNGVFPKITIFTPNKWRTYDFGIPYFQTNSYVHRERERVREKKKQLKTLNRILLAYYLHTISTLRTIIYERLYYTYLYISFHIYTQARSAKHLYVCHACNLAVLLPTSEMSGGHRRGGLRQDAPCFVVGSALPFMFIPVFGRL